MNNSTYSAVRAYQKLPDAWTPLEIKERGRNAILYHRRAFRRRRQAQRVQTAVNRLFISSLGLFLLALLVG